VPILYLTELIGVAFASPHSAAWFEKHMVSPKNLLAAKGLI
jgi:hypothetical protein